MLDYIKNITDEAEARRILMKLGNGLTQVEEFISEWKALKPKVKQKVVVESSTETTSQLPKTNKIIR